jgi:interleukin-1 receptor-associated kinase 1
MQLLPGVPTQFNFNDIRRATNNFHETTKLGRGGFGAVYRCRHPGPKKSEALEVAVKKFSRDDNRRYEDFLAEVSVINRLRHKNIVPLVGNGPYPILCLFMYETLFPLSTYFRFYFWELNSTIPSAI